MKTQLEQPNIAEYELISTKISSYFPQVAEMYYWLIIVPCDACGGQCDRTQKINFQEIAEFSNNRYINVNLELSRELLELTQRQRSKRPVQVAPAHFTPSLQFVFSLFCVSPVSLAGTGDNR
ncbi:MAG: hypothetical protein V7K48_08875 [Nostoc sp.]|uniref:hypothetical protein n=1 Tax=Nostoc sp. TaxID=1180 RepID=UPI002FFAE018